MRRPAAGGATVFGRFWGSRPHWHSESLAVPAPAAPRPGSQSRRVTRRLPAGARAGGSLAVAAVAGTGSAAVACCLKYSRWNLNIAGRGTLPLSGKAHCAVKYWEPELLPTRLTRLWLQGRTLGIFLKNSDTPQWH